MVSYKDYFFQIDEENFEQIGFLKFIIKSINSGFLKPGMILILDNCWSLHFKISLNNYTYVG
jgi:hypothetical protein